MTREEAIMWLNAERKARCKFGVLGEGSLLVEALDMAIEALSEVRCNDCKWNDDVIEVVRCKDCRHYEYGHCYEFGGQMNHDDYCSHGATTATDGKRAEQTNDDMFGIKDMLDKLTLRGDDHD